MPDIDALFSDRTQLARIRAEADFGLRELQGLVAKLSHGSRVLEIGCGTGFLLTRLNALRPDLHLTGLEPLGQGFQGFEQTLDRIQAAVREIEIVRLPIEQFSVAQDHERFDLIFSVNVFEHVDDWEQAVKRSMATLSPNGQMVILCPNYAVPYEPHFAIPIIGGPTLTRKLFGRHIEAVEARNHTQGLWKSINFISVPALKKYCRRENYALSLDRSVMARMVDRLESDSEFAKRQAAVSTLALMLRRCGVVKAMQYLPAALSPFLKATISLSHADR